MPWCTVRCTVLCASGTVAWPTRNPPMRPSGRPAKAITMGTESRGAPNARAKRELDWTLRYPSWRQGITAAYGQQRPYHGRV
jgi:hypothetical protein